MKSWKVTIKRGKWLHKLPKTVLENLHLLICEIELSGPVRGNWKNYAKLSQDRHHCHIKSGHPTYVACWKSLLKERKVIIYYVGTHEKAPY